MTLLTWDAIVRKTFGSVPPEDQGSRSSSPIGTPTPTATSSAAIRPTDSITPTATSSSTVTTIHYPAPRKEKGKAREHAASPRKPTTVASSSTTSAIASSSSSLSTRLNIAEVQIEVGSPQHHQILFELKDMTINIEHLTSTLNANNASLASFQKKKGKLVALLEANRIAVEL